MKSNRAPVGATNRSDLFTSRNPNEDQAQAQSAEGNFRTDKENEEANNSPLQLEHMLGYSGEFKKTVVTSQSDENVFYKG